MFKKKLPLHRECGLHYFKELLEGKWKLMLIYYISIGMKRPGALLEAIPTVDRRVMNKQLDQLVAHGFLLKKDFSTKTRKVEYELTGLGKSLIPLIMEIEKWGEANRSILDVAVENDPKFEHVI